MRCALSSRPATLHLTEIAGKKVTQVDLCQARGRKKGLGEATGFPWPGFRSEGVAAGTARRRARSGKGSAGNRRGRTKGKRN